MSHSTQFGHLVMCVVDGSQLVASQWAAHNAGSAILHRGVDERFGLPERFSIQSNQENIVRSIYIYL